MSTEFYLMGIGAWYDDIPEEALPYVKDMYTNVEVVATSLFRGFSRSVLEDFLEVSMMSLEPKTWWMPMESAKIALLCMENDVYWSNHPHIEAFRSLIEAEFEFYLMVDM